MGGRLVILPGDCGFISLGGESARVLEGVVFGKYSLVVEEDSWPIVGEEFDGGEDGGSEPSYSGEGGSSMSSAGV
jgi:hypothetical protein